MEFVTRNVLLAVSYRQALQPWFGARPEHVIQVFRSRSDGQLGGLGS